MEQAYEETTFSFSTEPPQPQERRQQPRHLTILRVGALIVEGRRELCLIRNISAGGMMVHAYSNFQIGLHLSIELKTNQQVSGKVAWINGSNIGVTFDEHIDLEELLATQPTLDNGWLPRLPRVEVDRLATLRAGAMTYGVNTCDISQGGVKIETDQAFAPGQQVVLTPHKFRPVEGVVRWYHEGMCGIAFNQLIPFHELMKWLKS